jgi:hypothetical protein
MSMLQQVWGFLLDYLTLEKNENIIAWYPETIPMDEVVKINIGNVIINVRR